MSEETLSIRIDFVDFLLLYLLLAAVGTVLYRVSRGRHWLSGRRSKEE